MDPAEFRMLVKNFTNLTEDECTQVRDFASRYPYSQLLHHLVSRASQDLRFQNKADALHESAVYATDRSVLKWVMTAPQLERVTTTEPEPTEETATSPIPKVVVQEAAAPESPAHRKAENARVVAQQAPLQHPQASPTSLSGDALRADLLSELKKLKKLKHEFELSVEQFEKSGGKAPALPQSAAPEEPATEPLLEEIKATKKKLKADNPRLREQNEIIDQFIKTQPVIPKPNASAPASDLAEDSALFTDNIVSETLVNILLKQGKKEKAIEVLKKLIWKFPQKKAYFAAKIEELKI